MQVENFSRSPIDKVRYSLKNDKKMWLTPMRLIALLLLFFFLGLVTVKYFHALDHYLDYPIDYFDSFDTIGITQFINNAFISFKLNMFIVSISGASAFTFFCPTIIYALVSFVGVTNGICVALSNISVNDWRFVWFCIYVTVLFFVLICFETIIIKFNRSFLDHRNHAPKHCYIARIVKAFFKSTLVWFFLFIILHTIYCIVLFIL